MAIGGHTAPVAAVITAVVPVAQSELLSHESKSANHGAPAMFNGKVGQASVMKMT